MRKSNTSLEELHEYGVDVDRRTVRLFGEINSEVAERFITNIDYLFNISNETVTVKLCSPGGDVNMGLAIYDSIKDHTNVVIVATGEVMSMAVAILQAAPLRYATPGTRFMVHQGSTEVSGNDDEVTAETRESRATSKIYKHILLDRIRIIHPTYTSKSLGSLIRRTTYFDAKRALELGLIDGVVCRGISEK